MYPSVFGLPIIISSRALMQTSERLFPESRHRSARIEKKLIKRFGGVFRSKPANFETPQRSLMHSARYETVRCDPR
jgi:hypothetical protein